MLILCTNNGRKQHCAPAYIALSIRWEYHRTFITYITKLFNTAWRFITAAA